MSSRLLEAIPQEVIDLIEPRVLVPLDEAPPFPCGEGQLRRDPRETKGADYRLTTDASGAACASGSNSCC